jgi:fructose-specific phosphotransferase system component IIB
VAVALSTTELMVAEDIASVAERKEVDKTLSETGPTGVGAMLSVAEVRMSEAVMVLMEVLMPATELSQLVTVTVTVATSCGAAMAPMAAACASVELQRERTWRSLLTSGDKGHGSKDELHFDDGRWIMVMRGLWLMNALMMFGMKRRKKTRAVEEVKYERLMRLLTSSVPEGATM